MNISKNITTHVLYWVIKIKIYSIEKENIKDNKNSFSDKRGFVPKINVKNKKITQKIEKNSN